MRSILFPILIFSAAVHAAAPAARIPLSADQARALGIESQAATVSGAALASALPAQVVVPNEQLRVVAAPLAGLVVRIDVAPGQNVNKGQVLARLASPALLAAGRDYLQAAQQAQLAAQAARRDEQLFSEGIIAEARHQATQSDARQAAVALAARREELRLAGVSESALAALQARSGLPSEVTITSPIDGVVLEQFVQPGQRFEAAAALFRIGKLSPLWLEIQTPAVLAWQLQAGLVVSIPASGAQGKVINVGRQTDPGSQSVTVRARIDVGAEKLSPGQMVEAMIAVPARGDAGSTFRIAQSAVVRHQGQAYVFVQETDAFRPLPVTLVGQAGDQVLLRSPVLKPDTRLAVKGLAALKAAWLGVLEKSAEGG
ncbi:MAG: efflux RND transporter periplasmic adaptor subunit [Burkholderiales bacterium]|nr:efflux RND transporter periplasmic adaptor subunit [Burkholderiales bacterium]